MKARTSQRFVAVARALTCMAILAAGACDRAPDAANPATRAAPATRTADAPRPTRVAFEPVGNLPPGRPAQLAAGQDGAVYALVAESPGAAAIVRRVDGAPRAERFGPEAVVAALGLGGRASGQVVAIAARDDGRLAFAFAGDAATDAAGTSRHAIAAMGVWEPSRGEIRVTVDQADLARVDSTLAEDVAAAAPTLIVAGDDAWLWRARAGGEIRLVSARALGSLRPDLSARTIAVGGESQAERRAWEWSAEDAAAGRFLLTDTASRWIRRLDAGAGKTEHVARFDDDAGVSAIAPATLDAGGRVMTLALDRDGVARSLLVQDGASFAAIDAARFAPAGVAGAAAGPSVDLHVGRLVPVPGRPGRFVAHDVPSGRVFRVTVE